MFGFTDIKHFYAVVYEKNFFPVSHLSGLDFSCFILTLLLSAYFSSSFPPLIKGSLTNTFHACQIFFSFAVEMSLPSLRSPWSFDFFALPNASVDLPPHSCPSRPEIGNGSVCCLPGIYFLLLWLCHQCLSLQVITLLCLVVYQCLPASTLPLVSWLD